MFRNYLMAALRNLARNKLYATINIGGLAIGFATVMLIALFVRDEFSYDQFILGHDKTYLIQSDERVPGRAPFYSDNSPGHFAEQLKLDFSQVEASARISTDFTPGFRHGDIEYTERLYWSDANIFDLLPLPVAHGDLAHAFDKPNSLVITQNLARKYFDREDVVGETLDFERSIPMTITAVIKNLPSNTHLASEIFGNGSASTGPLRVIDQRPPNALEQVLTYIRLKPGASIDELQKAMPDFVERHYAKNRLDISAPELTQAFYFVPVDQIHLSRADFRVTKPHGHIETIYAISAIGVLIVIAACMNFINLMTARAARRAVEVGIRKVSGATQGDLILQFIGEGVIYVTLGTILAMALVELSMPVFNAFLDRTIVFDWWRDPLDLTVLFCFVAVIGVLAGFYPAQVLSAFKPAAALKSGRLSASGSGLVRHALVVFQCAVMAGLMLATVVIYRQIDFALNDALRIDKDEMLIVKFSCYTRPDGKNVVTSFRDEVAKLPGVRSAACGSLHALEIDERVFPVVLPDGTRVSLAPREVDFGFFEVYSIKPVAGRLFSRDHTSDAISPDPKLPMSAPVILNEAGMRKLGFRTPEEALGKLVRLPQFRQTTNTSEIIGIVPDYSLDTIHNEVSPAFYVVQPQQSIMLNVKLDGERQPETLKAIDGLWKKFGDPQPIDRYFLDTYLQSLYRDVSQQGNLFGIFAAVAVFIAALGLLGLSAFSAERRTKEIGIRKAMGASTAEIMRLMLWEFTKPVLWANLIAWPASYFLLRHWLEGFVRRIDLELWMFLSVSMAVLIIAWLTVSTISLLAVRGKPVDALRYE